METKEHIPEPMDQGSNQKLNLKKKEKRKTRNKWEVSTSIHQNLWEVAKTVCEESL